MLMTKTQDTPYIRIFKLVTGEEIITKVVSIGEKAFLIENPLQMAMGHSGVQLAPFLFMVEKKSQVSLRIDAVVADAEPDLSLSAQYESITTGIALPTKSPIVTM